MDDKARLISSNAQLTAEDEDPLILSRYPFSIPLMVSVDLAFRLNYAVHISINTGA
jgi:hypothetical protein